MTANEELALLSEWREILVAQHAIILKRGDGNDSAGPVGALVAEDELALQYQALNSRIWDIRRALFGEYYLNI